MQPKGSAGLWVGLSMYLLILPHRLFQMNLAINQLKKLAAAKKASSFGDDLPHYIRLKTNKINSMFSFGVLTLHIHVCAVPWQGLHKARLWDISFIAGRNFLPLYVFFLRNCHLLDCHSLKCQAVVRLTGNHYTASSCLPQQFPSASED